MWQHRLQREDKNPLRARVLARYLREHGLERSIGAELGVCRGQTTFHLLHVLPELSLVAIDRWERMQFYNETKKVHRDVDFARLEQGVRDKARKFPDRLAIIKDDTSTALRKFPAGHFDWVFIDGDHSEEGCSKDIRAALHAVRADGHILGHDITWGGVEAAVTKLLGDYTCIGDSVWAHSRS